MKLFLSNTIVSLALLFFAGCSTSTDVALPISSDSDEAIELYKEAFAFFVNLGI